MTNRFDDIRPYYDSEVKEAVQRVIADQNIYPVIQYLFPEKNPEEFKAFLSTFETVYDFQIKLMHKVIRKIVEKSAKELTYSGFENITPGESYLFIANHRDIMLDSSILQILLHENEHSTSEITFGSNLMKSQFIIDIGRLNKMFKVNREATGREILLASKELSAYMRYTIKEKKQAAWIAQRSGRTKDGNDRTEQGVIKMLSMSGSKDFVENFSELRIVPLTISYEYEPCDIQKVREMYISSKQEYIKAPDEDLKSILAGITDYKGRIHFSVGEPIVDKLKEINNNAKGESEKHKQLVLEVDRQIHKDYKLWPNNYIAADTLREDSKYSDEYTETEKAAFLNYIDEKVSAVDINDKAQITKMMLELYSWPVLNIESYE
ncbi:MAG: acyltransferase [Marinilabiliales bacterium]|nr:MAG: acyltransferase [Marinilabiliales bacterium]